MLPNDWKLFVMKWYCVFVFIVIIVKTMFRFWPRSPSSLNQPRNKRPWTATSVHLQLYSGSRTDWLFRWIISTLITLPLSQDNLYKKARLIHYNIYNCQVCRIISARFSFFLKNCQDKQLVFKSVSVFSFKPQRLQYSISPLYKTVTYIFHPERIET